MTASADTRRALADALDKTRALAADATLGRGERRAAEQVRAHLERAVAVLDPPPPAAPSSSPGAQLREDLLAIVCHDLRDPLSAIMMGTTFLLRIIPAEAEGARMRKMTEAIQRSATRMNGIIHDFHDLARIEAGRLPLDKQGHKVAALMEAAGGALEARAKEKGVRFEARTDASAAETELFCDNERIVQVITNLADNAIRNTERGASVTVSASVDGESVRFVVKDAGRGIPEARMPHIFDRRFNATQPARDGAGLGLALAHGIVVAHYGTIEAESEVGKGSTFTFLLPLGAAARESIPL